MTHICVSKLTIIGSDNCLSPERRQANVWTNAGILLIGTLGTNFSEILREIHTFSFKKMHLKTSSAKRRPFCFGLNMLNIGIVPAYRCLPGPLSVYQGSLHNPWCKANIKNVKLSQGIKRIIELMDVCLSVLRFFIKQGTVHPSYLFSVWKDIGQINYHGQFWR